MRTLTQVIINKVIVMANHHPGVSSLERLRQSVAPEPPITGGPGERWVSFINLT